MNDRDHSGDIPEALRTALRGRYDLQDVLGRGGMATVYLAEDSKHQRQVAVKVMRPDLTASIAAERFLREIRIASKLTHPHILMLLESGEADGFLYYAMPLAEGSLRGLLVRKGHLALDQALDITREVANALDYAHRQGILHRDIKPENILLSEGHAVVADFGIAKAITTAGGEHLTRTGFPVGTLGYMSPEQAAGRTDLDERTDIYSLASVFYESVIGETPGVWLTPEEVRLGRFFDVSPQHRERLDELPGRVEQTLARAMAVRPAERFATPGEFVAALATASERTLTLTDSQVREILARAAQLQAEQPTEYPTEGGALSIGAIEQVAAEVGIPPEHVRDAIWELEHAPDAGTLEGYAPPPMSFNPTSRLLVHRSIAREVLESEYVAMVEEIQATLGTVGHVSKVGESMTWSVTGSREVERNVQVEITPEAGRTRIRIEENLGLFGAKGVAPMFGAAGGALLGLLIAAVMGERGVFMVIPGALLAFWGAFATANSIVWSDAKQRRPELEGLADRLAAIANRAGRPAQLEPPA
jgi:serine/threonine protein kinase